MRHGGDNSGAAPQEDLGLPNWKGSHVREQTQVDSVTADTKLRLDYHAGWLPREGTRLQERRSQYDQGHNWRGLCPTVYTKGLMMMMTLYNSGE